MRLHYIQHVPFETLGLIEAWAREKGHTVTGTKVYEQASLPALGDFDMAVVLGGPMGANDERLYPWLSAEKAWIAAAIRQKKPLLGICLGAQLIAEAIGGKVRQNYYREIGWFPVELAEAAKHSPLFRGFPDRFVPFHWHGDTFELPDRAVRTASSKGCPNQAFVYEDYVVGLQFHLEMDEAGISRMLKHGKDDLIQGPYVQKPEEMADRAELVNEAKAMLHTLLDALERRCSETEYRRFASGKGQVYPIIGD
ncbi:type 1 glutamine amidotransferase [Paenibacillus ehimensis]|uniref:type 1 glutamine amidotransferase n=1 Tax=Paenibacillus ehimensis TaxID=79264 RepID=UPI000FDB6C24|nr:type 1 glutamine amidotransferase [Paenibacillus ehimensis]